MGKALEPGEPSSHSYVEALEIRVRQLEQEAPRRPIARDDQTTTEAHHPQQAEEQLAVHDVDSAMQDMHYLPLSAMAEPREQNQASLHQLSFKTFVLASANVCGEDPTSSKALDTDAVQDLRQQSLPSISIGQDVVELSLQRYLDMCCILCPCLEDEALRKSCTRVLIDAVGAEADKDGAPAPDDIVLTHLAVATGILLSRHKRLKTTVAADLASKALETIPQVLRAGANTSVVRTLMAMAVYSMHSAFHGSTWHLVGLAVGRAFSAGLHTDGASNWRSGDSHKRENSRSFWALYVLDAAISSTLDRPFCIQDRDVTAPIPRTDSHSLDSNEMAAPLYESLAIESAQILRQIRKTPSMGSVFHVANHQHWKDMVEEAVVASISPPAAPVLHQIDRSSCLMCLQVIQSAEAHNGNGFPSHLYSYAASEFEMYLGKIQQLAGPQSESAFMWLDGCQVFSVGICCVGFWLHGKLDLGQQGSTQQMLRQCLQLLTAISNIFEGLGYMRDLLWRTHDLGHAVMQGAPVDIDASLSEAGSTVSQRDQRLLRAAFSRPGG